MARGEKRRDYIEPTWPASDDEHPVTELASDIQGADRPFGADIPIPAPIERHGRHWVLRPPGTPRHDIDYGGDESI